MLVFGSPSSSDWTELPNCYFFDMWKWVKDNMCLCFFFLICYFSIKKCCLKQILCSYNCRKGRVQVPCELCVWVAQSCPTLCNPMECNLPDSSVYAILQARILEWVAIPFSMGSSWPRDWTWVSCTAGGFFTDWDTREARLVRYLLTKGYLELLFPGRTPHVCCGLALWNVTSVKCVRLTSVCVMADFSSWRISAGAECPKALFLGAQEELPLRLHFLRPSLHWASCSCVSGNSPLSVSLQIGLASRPQDVLTTKVLRGNLGAFIPHRVFLSSVLFLCTSSCSYAS